MDVSLKKSGGKIKKNKEQGQGQPFVRIRRDIGKRERK